MTDREILQAAIDAGGPLPEGEYTIDDTLVITDGVGFGTADIRGAGSGYRCESTFGGTRIFTTFNDRPAIKIAGARRVKLSGIALRGVNMDYLQSQNAGETNPLMDDIDRANWMGPLLDVTESDTQYHPYQGIAIDPDVGDSFSSKVTIEDVWIGGFVVGLGIQLQDHDGNGDFVSLHHSNIEHCLSGIAAGNSQGRCFGTDHCQITNCHTALDTLRYGKQRGRFGGEFRNTTFESCIFMLNVKSDWNGPLVFAACFAENLYSFGTVVGANDQPVTFIGGDYEVGANPDWRGVPEAHIESGSPITFVGASVRTWGGFHATTPIQSIATNWLATRFNPDLYPASQVQGDVNARRWMNCGLLIDPKNVAESSTFSERTPVLNSGGGYDIIGDTMENATGHKAVVHMQTRWPDRGRFGAVRRGTYLAGPLGQGTSRTSPVLTYVDFSNPKACVLDVGQWFPTRFKASPGDIMMDIRYEGIPFIITEVGTTTFTMEALTGFRPDGNGGWEFNKPFPGAGTGGTWNWYCTRVYGVQSSILGDITEGSNVIANAGWADGTHSILTNAGYGTRVGDMPLTDNQEFYPFHTGAAVTAIDPVAGTITMTHPAKYTETRVPFTWWVRAPEA